MDELLTPHELIARLKISTRTYHRMVQAGQLPVKWVRESARFVWAEVLAALPAGGQKPSPVPTPRRRVVRGVTDLTTRLKRKAETWTRT